MQSKHPCANSKLKGARHTDQVYGYTTKNLNAGKPKMKRFSLQLSRRNSAIGDQQHQKEKVLCCRRHPRQEIMEHLRQAIADGRVKPIETAA